MKQISLSFTTFTLSFFIVLILKSLKKSNESCDQVRVYLLETIEEHLMPVLLKNNYEETEVKTPMEILAYFVKNKSETEVSFQIKCLCMQTVRSLIKVRSEEMPYSHSYTHSDLNKINFSKIQDLLMDLNLPDNGLIDQVAAKKKAVFANDLQSICNYLFNNGVITESALQAFIEGLCNVLISQRAESSS